MQEFQNYNITTHIPDDAIFQAIHRFHPTIEAFFKLDYLTWQDLDIVAKTPQSYLHQCHSTQNLAQ